MPARTGGNTSLGVTLATTFDGITQAGAGHKLVVDSITHSRGTTELSEVGIGSGQALSTDSDIGNFNPTVGFTKTIRSDDQGIALIKQLFGTETVTVLSTPATAHSFTYNAVSTANYANLAFHGESTAIFEYVNNVVTKLGIELTPNEYAKATYELLATNRLITATTNNAASLVATTEPATRQNFIVRSTDEVLINVQSAGVLASPANRIVVAKASIDYDKSQELVSEIKGSVGFGAPRASGQPPFMATITLELKTVEDFTYFTAHEAGTEYKLSVSIKAPTVIAGGLFPEINHYFPRLKVVLDPEHDVANAGENGMTVTFKALVASSIPTGMFLSLIHI